MSAVTDEALVERVQDVATAHTTKPGLNTSEVMYSNREQVESYARHRTRYTDQVFRYIVDYCRETRPQLDLCVDVGCGSGQSTTGFAKYFKKVIGVDISPHQIAHAPKHLSNMEFKVASAEQLPFIESASVDLWSSAESFNYMPEKETFAEADRVLKPGGTLVVFGYVGLRSEEELINVVIRKMIFKLLPYWPIESKATFEKFKDVKLPYPGWIRNDELRIHKRMTIEELSGLWKSFYAFVAYQDSHPDEDLLGEFETELRCAHNKLFGATKDEMAFDLRTDVFILIGRKPIV